VELPFVPRGEAGVGLVPPGASSSKASLAVSPKAAHPVLSTPWGSGEGSN
jgi:hypothetical protein